MIKKLKELIYSRIVEILTTAFLGGIIHVFWVVWVSFPKAEAKLEQVDKIQTVVCRMAIYQYKDDQKIIEACK